MENIDSSKTERVYLTGFMGTGKSTVGTYLSRITSRRIIDTDSLVEKETGMSIAEIFKSHGELYFRELERSVLITTFQLKNVIISTGGGLPAYKDNMKLINTHGISVCLTARPEIILSRVSYGKKTRPLLQEENALENLNLLMQKRAYYYISADIQVDTSDKTVEEISKYICEKAGIRK